MLRYVLEPGLAQRPPELAPPVDGKPDDILEALRATTIGAEQEVQTAFGLRRAVYADYTASGRASTLVEEFVQKKVLPFYGNTHTLTTATARQTTYLRAEAREVIRHHLNATHEDAVIFAGSGSTAAAHLFVQTLQRANFAVGGSQGEGADGGDIRDMHYKEDRWGGGECTLCGVRVKSGAIYQAHRHSEAHRAKLAASAEGSTGGAAGSAPGPPPRRRVVVLADPVLHHSSSLPLRELLPKHPLASPPALGGFSGSSWQAAGSSAATDGGAGGPVPAPPGSGGAANAPEVEVSTLPIDAATGLVDEAELKARLAALKAWREGAAQGPSEGARELVAICMLAAGSNVTGLCPDVPRVTAAARAALPGVVVCWDYAAAAGHHRCDLNPPGNAAAHVDAAFFSPHKLWGGPGCVGLLAVKKRLLCNAVPAVPGGGVVFYVSDNGHSYIQNSEEREEAGTPNILGCIRAGLVHHLLDRIPEGAVENREQAMLQRALGAWSAHPRIEILGPAARDAAGEAAGPARTGVVSFMVRYGNDSPGGLYLHYNYVAAILNDVFGVQARGGCACAGPYAQWLLGVDEDLSVDFEQCLMRTAQEVLRPGFVRVGVHWAMSDEDLEVLIAAVLWVADSGWKLLAAYTFDRETGEWLHRHDSPDRRRVWLSSVTVDPFYDDYHKHDEAGPVSQLEKSLGIGPQAPSAPRSPAALLEAADAVLRDAYSSSNVALSQSKWPSLDAAFAHLLWFALPADVAFTLRSQAPDRPQLLTGKGIFGLGQDTQTRPPHSVLDARAAWGFATAEGEAVAEAGAEEEDWEPLDSMIPEESDGEGAGPAAAAPQFSRIQLRPSIPKPLRGLVGKAIADLGMIKEGDRLLVGLSGGKDSLTVLHCLLALQKSAPIRFEVAAATVDPMTPEFNPFPLKPYMEALGVEYHMLSKPIIEMAKVHLDPKRPSLCAFCSRMKRGLLYSCMREKGFNVLVLGQHLDDFAESFLMSAIHNGLLRTMKANYWVTQEDVRVCRPLLYVRESMAAEFARENQLPIIADNCPACFAAPKERHKTKVLLSSLEFEYPQLFSTLLRTMRPLYALETASKDDGILAPALEDDDEPGGAPRGVGKRKGAARGAGHIGSQQSRDEADRDADAELALTSCGPSGACGDAIPELDAVEAIAKGAESEWTQPLPAAGAAEEVSPAAPQQAAPAATPLSAEAAACAGFAAGLAAAAGALLAARLLAGRRL